MASVQQIPALPSTQSAHTSRKRSSTTSTRSTFSSTYDEKGYPLQSEYPAQPRPRSSTVSGYPYQAATPSGCISTYSYTPASDTSYTQNTRSNTRTKPARSTLSPVPSSSGSSSSGKSVTFSDVDDCATIDLDHQRYSPDSRKRPSKSSLLVRECTQNACRSVFDEETQIMKNASIAVDKILYELVACVKKFECPSELYFSVDTGSPLILVEVEKNKPFIRQLEKLNAFRDRLARISTEGDENLEKRHAAIGAAIEAALKSMKQHQLKLYDQYVEASLDSLAIELDACVKQLENSLEYNPSASSSIDLGFGNPQTNRIIDAQLRILDGLWKTLDEIPSGASVSTREKRAAISSTLAQRMRVANEYRRGFCGLRYSA